MNHWTLTKDSLIIDSLDAVPQANREGGDQDVEVKEEAEPSGGLMLRHWGNDRDVDLGVARVPQRVEPEQHR